MNKSKEILQNEIRYAIRLTERTARLYRLVQTVGVFFSILGGSAAMASLSGNLPSWLLATGGALLAISGATLIAIRPADKAAQNENDVRRYRALMAKSHEMNVDQLAATLDEAHQTDVPEIESLREVAYNDVALESNRPDVLVPLSASQKILSALA
ncbi:MAG: hypothetical protein WC091_15070 [Sulfuricellaceae bacterium]